MLENNTSQNMAQLVNDNVNFIVRAVEYDVTKDSRLLIPFVKGTKVGFVNKSEDVVVEAKYDIFNGEAKEEGDCVKVGVRYQYIYQYTTGETKSYDHYKWGVIDANGKVLLEPEHKHIMVSTDKDLFTIDSSYVVNRKGETIVPKGRYVWVDGFDSGFARVKKEVEIDGKKVQRWGIIDANGTEVLEPVYTNIWNFYGKNRMTTCVEDGVTRFNFILKSEELEDEIVDDPCDDGGPDEGYGTHFGAYAGSYAQDVMGFSDDVIDDAFDGDPEAYWNID